jgi:hypothetical protein
MAITIPGGGGTVLVFTVEGSAATNYATDFANAVANLNPTNLATTSPDTAAGAFNVFVGGIGAPNVFTLSGSLQYDFFSSGQPDTINITGSGDTIAAGLLTTVNDEGTGDNRIIFEGGANVFNGNSASGDTIVGGFGSDTINTGTGASTVFTGVGDNIITLNDTSTSAGDVVIVDGNSTVDAFGVSDTVYAYGGGSVVGSSGALVYVSIAQPDGSAPAPGTVVGGSGSTDIFLTSGSDVTYQSTSTSNLATIVAGAGNETLNGASDSVGFYYFGDTSSSAAGVESVIGGTGTNYFATGAGTEDYSVGSGSADFFGIADLNGASITIADLSAASNYFINLAGLSVSAETAIVNTGTESGGNLIVSLGGNSTIEFLGVTASQIDSHLV